MFRFIQVPCSIIVLLGDLGHMPFVYACKGIKVLLHLMGGQCTHTSRCSDSAVMRAVHSYGRSSKEKGREAPYEAWII